jgi:hypothetical protein
MENRCKTKIFFFLLGILLLFPFVNAQTNSIDIGKWVQDNIHIMKDMNLTFATVGWYKSLDEGFGGKLPGGITRKKFISNAGNRPGDERSVKLDIKTGKEITANFSNYDIYEVNYILNRDGFWYDESGKLAPTWFQNKYGGLNRYWVSEVARQEEKVWRVK